MRLLLLLRRQKCEQNEDKKRKPTTITKNKESREKYQLSHHIKHMERKETKFKIQNAKHALQIPTVAVRWNNTHTPSGSVEFVWRAKISQSSY